MIRLQSPLLPRLHQRRVAVMDSMRFTTLAVDAVVVASRVNTGADIVAAEAPEVKVGDVVGSVEIAAMDSAVAVEGAGLGGEFRGGRGRGESQ